jgi:hypothetical protein
VGSVPPKGYRHLSVREEVYRELEEFAKEKGLSSVAEAVKLLLEYKSIYSRLEYILQSGVSPFAVSVSELARQLRDELARSLERKITDLLNPFTAKVDELAKRVAELQAKIEILAQQIQQKPAGEKPKKGAMERLAEEGVIFEADVAGKIRNREAFFEKLKREGAVVLELATQRAAAHPDFLKSFLKKLESINTDDESKLKKQLSEKELMFLKELRDSGYAVFAKERWRVELPEVEEGEEEVESFES